jgi:hypothetical protein
VKKGLVLCRSAMFIQRAKRQELGTRAFNDELTRTFSVFGCKNAMIEHINRAIGRDLTSVSEKERKNLRSDLRQCMEAINRYLR